MNYKRLAIFIGFIIAVLLLAGALYFFIFRPLVGPSSPTGPGTPGTLPGTTPGETPIDVPIEGEPTLPFVPGSQGAPDVIADGRETLVTDYSSVAVLAPINKGGEVLYFDDDSSSFVKMGADGTTSKLTDQQFYNIESIEWTPDKSGAVIEYPDGSNIYYNFNDRSQITLPKELTNFSIDSSGTSLAAIWQDDDTDNNWLMVASIDGSNMRIVEPVGDQGNDIDVGISADNQVVALYRKAISSDKQEIFPLGRNQENFPSFTVDGLKFESSWSPQGENLLYNVSSSKDDYKPRLWLTEGATGSLGYSQTDLQLNTWADKCTFNQSGSSIYCAEPTNLPRGAGLFPELADKIPDAFYRVDLVSGYKIPLALPVGTQTGYTAKDLFLSSDESILYFVDKQTNRLHSIRLK